MNFLLKAFILYLCLVSISCKSTKTKSEIVNDEHHLKENKAKVETTEHHMKAATNSTKRAKRQLGMGVNGMGFGGTGAGLGGLTSMGGLGTGMNGFGGFGVGNGLGGFGGGSALSGSAAMQAAGFGGLGNPSFDFADYYANFLADAAYDYYDWVCSGASCQLCDVLTGDCCDPNLDRNCFLPDSCANNPCLSGGTCISTLTVDFRPDFMCVCTAGLTGKYCQLIDEYSAPLPIAPVGPIGPIGPVGPVGPVNPVAPVVPTSSGTPVSTNALSQLQSFLNNQQMRPNMQQGFATQNFMSNDMPVQQSVPSFSQSLLQSQPMIQQSSGYGQQTLQQPMVMQSSGYGQQTFQQQPIQQSTQYSQASAPAVSFQQSIPVTAQAQYGQQTLQQTQPMQQTFQQQPLQQNTYSSGFQNSAPQNSYGSTQQLSANLQSEAIKSLAAKKFNGFTCNCPDNGYCAQVLDKDGYEEDEYFCICKDNNRVGNAYGSDCKTSAHKNPCVQSNDFTAADRSVPKNYFIECKGGLPFLRKCQGDSIWNQMTKQCVDFTLHKKRLSVGTTNKVPTVNTF